MTILRPRPPNLHDLAAPRLWSGRVPFAAAGVPIWPGFCPLSLSFSYLSHAKYALLRRNIISFQAVADDYFAYKRLNRRLAGPTRRNTAMFASLIRFLREWRRYNQSLNELSRLGDRELADIGISRSDIQRVAWGAARQR